MANKLNQTIMGEAIKAKGQKRNSGGKHSPEYDSIHHWLRRNYVKEKCENTSCSGKSLRLEWALKKGYDYERNRDHFIVLCHSCHQKYDLTEAKIKKLSEIMKNRVISKETRIKQHLHRVGKKPIFMIQGKSRYPPKSVTNIETGEVFQTIGEAINASGISTFKMRKMLYSDKRQRFVFTNKISQNDPQ